MRHLTLIPRSGFKPSPYLKCFYGGYQKDGHVLASFKKTPPAVVSGLTDAEAWAVPGMWSTLVGTSRFVEIPNPVCNFETKTTSILISLRIKMPTPAANTYIAASYVFGANTGNGGLMLQVKTDKSLVLGVAPDDGTISFLTAPNVCDGLEHTVSFLIPRETVAKSNRPSNAFIAVDGRIVGNNIPAINAADKNIFGTAPLRFGGQVNGTASVASTLGSFQIYAIPMDAADIPKATVFDLLHRYPHLPLGELVL